MGIKIAAMILAGGKGTRLKALTRKTAKPAVSYGAKYRIIDFPLSNCANSGINHVGVLTQYESSELNTYIGNGKNWGLNGVNSLTSVLTPKQTEEGSNWYRGTADAIYQNLDWLDSLSPEYVLILSGDHIYSTTYEPMLQRHLDAKADCTISVYPVPMAEASRFGILEVDQDGVITAFKEKPKVPKSNLASMGIYIFTYKTLRAMLVEDGKDETSDHDFGKNIIPKMMEKGKKLVAYTYHGYWKDVGTIASLHQANMDLLMSGDSSADLFSGGKRIYTEDNHATPQYIGPTGTVKDSLINQGAIVRGYCEHCVVSSGAYLKEGSKAINCVIMDGATLDEGAEAYDAIIGPDAYIGKGEKVNAERQEIALYTATRG